MNCILAKVLTTLISSAFAICDSNSAPSVTTLEQSTTQPARQEIILNKQPAPDLTDHQLHLAWIKISQNNTRYKRFRPKDSPIAGLRSFQCRKLNECFIIVTDQKAKGALRHKILVLYAREYDYKRRNYKPYWVKCDYALSRTSLFNSSIGVVAVEYLEEGGHKVSVLNWDEEGKAFTCNEVGSFSLVFPVE